MSWSVAGHDWAVRILKNHLMQEDTRHAYLFSGAPGIGKRTLAIQFAQALNCLNPPAPGDFCGECRICRQIAAQQHSDLSIVASDTVGGILKIDAIRELAHSLSLSPYEANYRVAILLRFDEANASAQNALLKTLEEPAERVKLLLTASSDTAVLPTIASRCEILRLRPMDVNALGTYLMDEKQQPQEVASRAAHMAFGRAGFAIQLIENPERMDQMTAVARDALDLMEQNTRQRFQFAAAYRDFRKRNELREVLQIWQSLYRDLLLVTAQDGADARLPLTFVELRPQLESAAARLTPDAVQQLLKELNQALDYLNANVSPQLLLENLLLNLP